MNRIKSRLGTELTAAVLVSFFCAFLLLTGLQKLGNYVLDRKTQTYEYYKAQQELFAGRLQHYVDDQKLSLKQINLLDNWVEEEQYVSLMVFQGDQLIYTSYPAEEQTLTDTDESAGTAGRASTAPEKLPEVQPAGQAADWDQEEYALDSYLVETLFPIQLQDGKVQTMIFCYGEYRYYQLITGVSIFLAFLLFVMVFLWFIKKKTSYIELLKDELAILEGGNLNYPVTIKGKDELGELAYGIDRMRNSIIERERAEQAARNANQELVTAMSHDLRSPLTSLLAYLELLEGGDFEDGEEKSHFIEKSHKKALQIKEMSNRLFEYFLIYGSDSGRVMSLEEADTMALLEQTVCEEGFALENQGFKVEMQMEEVPAVLPVNIELFRRVIDNIGTNLKKYAKKEEPVIIRCRKVRHGLEISFYNKKNRSVGLLESTGIGLKTCAKIMEEHGGLFHTEENDEEFTVTLFFPEENR